MDGSQPYKASMVQPRAAASLMALKSLDFICGKVPREGTILKALLPTPWEILRQSISSATIRSRMDALKCAHNDSIRYDQRRLVLFSDASVNDRAAAIAVSWRSGPGRNDWRSKHYGLPSGLSVEQSEFCGAIQAFSLAAQLCNVREDAPPPYDTVVVYTDATEVIRRFTHHQRYEEVDRFRDTLVSQAKLQAMVETFSRAKVKLELHWCPGHSGIAGNEISDRVSVRARALMSTRPETDLMGLQTYTDAIANRAPHRLHAIANNRRDSASNQAIAQKDKNAQSTQLRRRSRRVTRSEPFVTRITRAWPFGFTVLGIIFSIAWYR